MPGGLKPLPYPCGGTAETGWTAAQVCRVANDVAATRRTAPFAMIRATTFGPYQLHFYRGQNGVGSSYAPTNSGSTTGIITLTWPETYEDALAVKRKINIIGAKAAVYGSTGRKIIVYDWGQDGSTAPNAITIKTMQANGTPAAATFCLKIWCKPDEETTYETYGGDIDKRDSETEGTNPYAGIWLLELERTLKGTAYTTERTGLVWCQNFADARFWAGIWRAADRLANNSIPDTADESLEDWVERYKIPARPGSTRNELRRLCAAHYRSTGGAKQQNLYEAVSDLLGDMYVKIWYCSEELGLEEPPDTTYWEGINPGPAAYDLGFGTWMSERSHIVIEVENHRKMPLVDFKHLMDAQLYAVLSRLVPGTVTFDWAENVDGGFDLSADELDFGALGIET